MPVYDYQCQSCGHRWEARIPDPAEHPAQCPRCHGETIKRLFPAPYVARGTSRAPGTTCCGRLERCTTQPCSNGGSCRKKITLRSDHSRSAVGAIDAGTGISRQVRYLRAALGADTVSRKRSRAFSSCRGGALARPFSLPTRNPTPTSTHSSAPAAARPPVPSTARASAPAAWHIGLSFLLNGHLYNKPDSDSGQ